ncbi:MAG: DUF3460 family protein [Comamonas sp.]|jgi:hypothetical protein|nr:DUF3460 family protein [Comamonas sp.]HRL38208.1 DUF3460 family protein [Comamonas denitrificans]MBP7855068.1 DUF3460 family protein [Comamonas sp.]MBP7871847.1 DUF3460 family protein [Comamonas sp.]MBP7977977.1 DUF3460 family protein [Comamonas sp.]
MSIFARPHYTSEATNFIEQLKKDKPQLDAQQQQGRSLLWDKEVDADVWQDYRAGKVVQKAYVYYSYTPAGKRTTPI